VPANTGAEETLKGSAATWPLYAKGENLKALSTKLLVSRDLDLFSPDI
tara:strand:+ start:37 stop:180 length:144 start_codon:yes stop_codon:yes gene_type:complete